MSEQLKIVCPHCTFSKLVPAEAVPVGAKRVTCPRCRESFSLEDALSHSHEPSPFPVPPVTPAATAAPPGAGMAPPPSLPPSSGSSPRTLNFAFTGSARDYFGIWIVNTLLKLVTLAIYSAWAKVRTRRFFYGSTTLDGHPFEYLADPITLFKGWLIAAVAFVLYAIGTRVSPLLSGTVGLLVFCAFPWLVVRSRIFNAANSCYRNIRFGFRPNYREAYVVYAGLIILSFVSLGLVTPYAFYRQKKFLVENSSYGSTPFVFHATVKDFYLLFLKIVAGLFLIGGAAALLVYASGLQGAARGAETARAMAIIPGLLMPLIYFLVVVYGQTALANLSWNGTSLGSDGFRSTLRTRDMAWLLFSSGVAILLSLGLLVPWAKIRLARYRFQRLELQSASGLDGIVAAAGSGAAVGAAGEELGDLFDLPIEIAL